MLHINKITIKNFRPYYGTQTFDFGSKDGLSIVFGDNGIGKSSLIRAIKYVIYGEFDSSGIFKMKNELNIVAWEEQNYEMYVALDFVYNDDHYVLKRISRVKSNIYGPPRSDSDFEDNNVTLIKNELIVSPAETNLVLKNIIPKKISEYILFEGETISKYKDLLDNNKNLEIYDSIRKILGITTLENSKVDLEKYLDKLGQDRVKLVKENSQNEKLLKNLEELSEKQKNYLKEKEEAERDLEATRSDKEKYEVILKNNQRIRELINSKDEFKDNIIPIKEEINSKKAELKMYLKNYKSICFDVINNEISITPENIQKTIYDLEENNKIKQEINILSDLIKKSKCKYCGHYINASEMSSIESRISELKLRISFISDNDLSILDEYQSKIDILKSFSNQILYVDFNKVINDIETQIQTKLIEKDSVERKISNIDDQIEGLGGTADIEKVAKAYTTASKNEDLYQKNIKILDDEIKKIQEKIDDIISKSPSNIDFSVIDNKIKKAKHLIDILIKSIEKYSYNMRIKVQEDATLMFKNISENHEYNRLEFDEKYGLKLIDTEERVVPNISSGYMTLITISLIYGLHKNSSLTGTIILDAPFSVLTNFHRDKIIKTFQTLSPQVLLLVYKDQIDIESIRLTMQGKLINEFEIFQDRSQMNSSYKTLIREVL